MRSARRALLRPSALRDDAVVPGRIYTVGYEGLTPDGLVERLQGARISIVFDVRLNPTSRKPGFSRKALAERLERAGIEYVHERELGNPADNRDSFRNGDGNAGKERMRVLLSNGAGDALTRVMARASGTRVALLCVEREQARCHRGVIAEVAAETDPTLEVIPIL
ncbi:MAG: hypothetical protein QOI20_923 [Acidimicrobiaceae bacterium]|jgi:uncharacterized protein (DUF488 family)|nr:hypothetical protein [Acidimicrobiaceae bacterium]